MLRPTAYRKAFFSLSEKPHRYDLLLFQVRSYYPTSGPVLILFHIIRGRYLNRQARLPSGLQYNIQNIPGFCNR
jgi:hypothetical protein